MRALTQEEFALLEDMAHGVASGRDPLPVAPQEMLTLMSLDAAGLIGPRLGHPECAEVTGRGYVALRVHRAARAAGLVL